MNIVIIGSGYVGTTAAAIFALSGNTVTTIDIDGAKVKMINNGKAPFYEDGLDNIISASVQKGTLFATTGYADIKDADVVFSCVGTPDKEDGSCDLDFVFEAARQATSLMKPGSIYVQKSTVPVGTGRKVMELLDDSVYYVSNPEFLREGTAIKDTLLFDRVVAGGDNKGACQKIIEIHKKVENHAEEIAKKAQLNIAQDSLIQNKGSYVSTGLESAELIKVTANAFLALKISFANSIAKLCDKTGADILEVMNVVGKDKRIGRAFLNAGRGYGGGCFPKDVSGLINTAKDNGVDMSIMQAASDLNQSMPDYVIDAAKKIYGDLDGKNIAVLGLSFKPGTSDTRKSPAIRIANKLSEIGARVIAHDPRAINEARPSLADEVKLSDDLRQATKDAEVIFIATDWEDYMSIQNWAEIAPNAKLIVDTMNCITLDEDVKEKIRYIGVGKST